MFTKRTDLAIEAHELWQESAGKTTRLAGVKGHKSKYRDIRSHRVDILHREGEAALGKPGAATSPLTLPPSGSGGMGFSTGRCGPWGSKLKELTPDRVRCWWWALGNRAMTPDAVGPLAADSVLITRHLIAAMPRQFSGFRPVAALRPGVLGPPAMESAEAVRAWWRPAVRRRSSRWTRWPPGGWGGCAVRSSSATPASSPAAA